MLYKLNLTLVLQSASVDLNLSSVLSFCQLKTLAGAAHLSFLHHPHLPYTFPPAFAPPQWVADLSYSALLHQSLVANSLLLKLFA